MAIDSAADTSYHTHMTYDMEKPMDLTIRPAMPDDAAEIERLYLQSAAYLRALGDTSDFRFNAEVYMRDGFGASSAFAAIVAERAGELVGYLIYTFGYDTDRAWRTMFVADLLVDESTRGGGVGRALMAEAVQICRAEDGGELLWAVYDRNTVAYEFYRRLGAQDVAELRFMSLRV
jgi:GNAT superfamily N-acetyltransferase